MFDITYDLAFYDNDEHLRFGSLYMDAEKIVEMINWMIMHGTPSVMSVSVGDRVEAYVIAVGESDALGGADDCLDIVCRWREENNADLA